jgi:spore coat polysaccharide biosynthesis protein SpsF
MLWHIVTRLQTVRGLRAVVVATTTELRDDSIRALCADAGFPCFSGSEPDVLDRFYQAALSHDADPVVRVTADCPLVDPGVVSRVLETYGSGQFDHVGVATGAGAAFDEGGRFPDGLDAECLSFAALARAWREATAPTDREHVTPFLWRVPGRFRLGVVRPDADYSMLRWTVDTAADFDVVKRIYAALYEEGRVFGMADVLAHLERHPELTSLNQSAIGQEGYHELWRADGRRGVDGTTREGER